MAEKTKSFLLCLLVASLHLAALDPRRSPSQYCLDAFTVDRGFPNPLVLDVIQTRDRFFWMATWDGLVAFDGERFTHFSSRTIPEMKNNMLMDLLEDRQGRLWIATWGDGLLCRERGRFRSLTTREGLAGNLVRCLAEDRAGKIWVGTDSGLSVLEGSTAKTYRKPDGLVDNRIKTLLFDRGGRLWIGTAGGVSSFFEGRFRSHPLGQDISGIPVYSLIEDRQGRVLAAAGSGIMHLQGERFLALPLKGAALGALVSRLFEDSDGSLWVGAERGLFRIRDATMEKVEVGALKDQAVTSITEDDQKNIWIGTSTGTVEDGVYRLRNGRFLTYEITQGGESRPVYGIFEQEANRFLVSTEGGVYLLANGRLRPAPEWLPNAGATVTSFFQDQRGDRWLGTMDGLWRLSGKRRFPLPELAGHLVSAIAGDRGGGKWIGTSKGLYFIPPTVPLRLEMSSFLQGRSISALFPLQDGSFWACTSDSGVYKIGNGKVLRHLDKSSGLISDDTHWIVDDGSKGLWVGTEEGLCWVTDRKVHAFTSHDGLPADTVYALLEDGAGNFWISSDNGVYVVSKGELVGLASGKTNRLHCLHYTEADGLKSRICNGGALAMALHSSSGQFWFATHKGAALVDPDRGRDSTPPVLYIKEVRIDGQPVSSFFDPAPANLEVPAGNKRIDLRFTALPCNRPERVRFMYRMDGFDRDWVYGDQQRLASYTNLKPGAYAFHVKASNEDGIWNESGTVLAVKIRSFVFQRLWFQILTFLLLASLFSLGVQVARRYLRAMEFWRRRHYVGHYKLLESVGSGGMGTVYRARDIVHPYREVALKVLRDSDFASEAQQKRFKKESMIIERLDDPHIIKILEKGEQGDLHYLAMEYLRGETLFDKLQREKCLGLAEGVYVMLQLCDVLARIHEKNIVHRDLKPHNIMVVPREGDPLFVKLLDFGVAVDFNQSRMTESGIIVGTLRYLPPEAIQSGNSSAAGDVYSLGVIFYEMITGDKPFMGDTPAEVYSQIVKFQAELPKLLSPEIPPSLGALLKDMIDRHPDSRPSCSQVRGRLLEIQREFRLYLEPAGAN